MLKKAEAAQFLNMSVSWLEKAGGKEIPVIKIGSAVRYDPADLRAWIESKKIASGAGAQV